MAGGPRLVVDNAVVLSPGQARLERQVALVVEAAEANAALLDAINRAVATSLRMMAELADGLPDPGEETTTEEPA